MRNSRTMRLPFYATLGASVFLALAACGQKGPLYLPDKGGEVITRPAGTAPPTQAPQTVPEPSTQPADGTLPKPAAERKNQTPR